MTKNSEKTVGLLLIGGSHHILHLIPIASELVKDETVRVIIFVRSDFERSYCADVLERLEMPNADIQVLSSNFLLRLFSPKIAALFSSLLQISRLDALVVAERTSTILRRAIRRMPLFIHIPHGAGDRAKSYDKRIRKFDHVLVAGQKDKRRMLELGLVGEDSCHVTGYIKPYAVKSLNLEKRDLFPEPKTTVLYNPHFESGLTSWDKHGFELLDKFADMQQMNFIFAPHVRLLNRLSRKCIARLRQFERHPNILVDLGSINSVNMAYTQAADIYLGDVSSQVYEFLTVPKPCVFITGEVLHWENDPDYAHWKYGRVCDCVQSTISALIKAPIEHKLFVDNQVSGCREAKGDPDWNPIARAAEKVLELIHASAASSA